MKCKAKTTNLRGVMVAIVIGAALGAATSAIAANIGQPVGPAAQPQSVIPQSATTPVLTYDTFTGGTCDATAFNTAATGHDNANGFVDVSVTTTLNGAAYTQSGVFSLGPGPFSFATSFGNGFAPVLTSNTWTYVFNSRVSQTGNFLGTSVTTIQCTGGVLSATNAWVPGTGVPTLSTWALIALGLALLAIGFVAVRRRMRTI
jgi:hypothetical protein